MSLRLNHTDMAVWKRTDVTVLFMMLVVSLLVSPAAPADVNYEIEEQSPLGALIGNIPESIDLARIVPEANLPSMRYNFLGADSEYLELFKLDSLTGNLQLSEENVLDREDICQFDSKCIIQLQIAIQSLQTQFFRKVFVDIDVLDVNDHAPEFTQNKTTLTISESVQIPSAFPLPSASDRDKGGNNSLSEYEIFPPDGPFELSYSKDSPNLMLRVVKELDHEDKDSYFVKIIARDGGNPPKEGILNADIVVEDVNDNAPKFTQESYETTVDETVQQGSVLLTLTATDKDSGLNGAVRYTLSPLQPAEIRDMFNVDEESGDLKLVGDLQAAETDQYRVGVEASDKADQPFTTQAWVSIMVENTINSPPRLVLSTLSSQEFSSISEYANLGVAVAHLQVKDADRGPNGIVSCNLTHSQGYFELQSIDVKEYKVIVARPLDRETNSIHNLTVSCHDAGIPLLSRSKSFQVHVTDENDKAPKFAQSAFRASIKENNKEGEGILTVSATDLDDPNTKNGRIAYSLRDVENQEFLIDSYTGAISAMQHFDYELQKSVNFTVVAEDGGIPRRSAVASVVVTILDVNDQAPRFAQDRFIVAVSEYVSPSDLIGQISAFDFEQGDNGKVELSIVPGSGRKLRKTPNSDLSTAYRKNPNGREFEDVRDDELPFEVHANGSVFLTEPVDYEECSLYQFEVLATDKGQPPLSSAAAVVVEVLDENDNPPRILHPNVSETVFTAYAGHEAPETLTVFEVRDADSGSNCLVTYTITARNDSRRFEIDRTRGAVKRTRDLFGVDRGVYKLSVVVRDSGTPPLSDVRTLLINVTGPAITGPGNGTASGSRSNSDEEKRYVVIALTLVCVTVLLSVTIVLVIVVMRRLDRRRKLHGGGTRRHFTGRTGGRGPMHIQNSAFMDPMKMDNFRNDQVDRNEGTGGGGGFGGGIGGGEDRENEKRMNDSQFGFPHTANGSMSGKNPGGESNYQTHQVNNLSLPASASREGDLDLEALQLHHVLLQTYQEAQARAPVPEDGASDSSGDTITSDSGRGGSDEDISNANVAAGNSLDESRPGHNASFLSNASTRGQNGSLKSSVRPPKDPVRASGSSRRKHVTFQDMERFRNSVRSQSATPDQQKFPQQQQHQNPPALSSTSADNEDKITLMRGPLAQGQQPQFRVGAGMSSFGPGSNLGGSRTRGHQNPLTELNIPVNTSTSGSTSSSNNTSISPRGMEAPRNAGMRRDNPAYNSFGGYSQAKNSPRGMPATMTRDSPILQTFLSSGIHNDNHLQQHQPPFSNMNSPRLPFYDGGDTSDSLPRTWSDSPRSNDNGSNNLNSSNKPPISRQQQQQQQQHNYLQQPYVHMSSPRDRLNPQQQQHHPAMPNNSLSARNSPRSLDPQITRGHESLPASPRVPSPTPLLPPRDSVVMDSTTNMNHNALLGNNAKHQRSRAYPGSGSNPQPNSTSKMASFLATRDWTTDSIATTEDCDDQRSTTTSGSYTIDNEDDYLSLEFKPKDVVV